MSSTHLEDLIKTRQSIRSYLYEKKVPEDIIRHALEVARSSSSNLNTQPWRLIFLSSEARDRVSARLQAAWRDKVPPSIAPIPVSYKKYQEAFGKAFLNETLGFAHGDDEARFRWFEHNFNFFKAPTAVIIMMDAGFHHEDSVGVGLFLDAFGLVLQEQDIVYCLQVSIAGYSDLLRKELGIGEDMMIICGMAIGYPDPAHPANHFKAAKEPIDVFAKFVME